MSRMHRLRTYHHARAFVGMAYLLGTLEMPSEVSAQSPDDARTHAKALYDEALKEAFKKEAKHPELDVCPLLVQALVTLSKVVNATQRTLVGYVQTGAIVVGVVVAPTSIAYWNLPRVQTTDAGLGVAPINVIEDVVPMYYVPPRRENTAQTPAPQ